MTTNLKREETIDTKLSSFTKKALAFGALAVSSGMGIVESNKAITDENTSGAVFCATITIIAGSYALKKGKELYAMYKDALELSTLYKTALTYKKD